MQNRREFTEKAFVSLVGKSLNGKLLELILKIVKHTDRTIDIDTWIQKANPLSYYFHIF